MIDMKRMIMPALLSAVIFASAPPPAQAATYAYHRGYHMVHDRIGMAHAREIALGVHRGRITNEALVRGRNGEERYVFQIRNRGGIYAVGVDADSGRVVADRRQAVRVYRRSENFWDRLFAPTHFGP